jgi:uncharacterized protein YybS (DUF2232 family)
MSALLFSCLVVPIVGLAVACVAPLPLTLQRLRGGLGGALLATLLAASVVGLAFSPGQALTFLLCLAGPGLLLGEGMARGRGLQKACLWAFALLALEIGTLLFFASPQVSVVAVAPFEQLRSPEFLARLRSSGWPPDRVETWEEESRAWQNIIEVVYPAAFVIAGALVVLANAALLRIYLARRDPGWLDGGEFESIRWPLGMSMLFVLSGLTVVVPPLRSAGYNILLLLAFVYALQGLAVIAYYAHRLAGPPILRIGLMVLVLANPWAPQILALLGLFDTWFDFRRYATPPED